MEKKLFEKMRGSEDEEYEVAAIVDYRSEGKNLEIFSIFFFEFFYSIQFFFRKKTW